MRIGRVLGPALVVVALLLAACEQTSPAVAPATSASPVATPAATSTPVPLPTPTLAPVPTSTPTPRPPTPTATPVPATPTPLPTPVPTPTQKAIPTLLEFTGQLPSIGPVTYTIPEGGTVTVPAFQGWVSLVVIEGVTPDQMARTAGSAEGTIVEANVRLGLYTVSVPSGKEGALIARLRQETWVVEVSPVFLVGPAQGPEKPAKFVDLPYDPKEPPSKGGPCGDFHGNLTALQATTAGRRSEVVDVRPTWLEKTWAAAKAIGGKLPETVLGVPWNLHTANKIAEAMETGSVVNVSLQAKNDVEIAGLSYKFIDAEYRHQQAAFLAAVFRAAESGPDVPVIVAAGNGDALGKGHDFTRYMEALHKQFPKAAKKVRIVEAVTKDGKRAEWSNYSSTGSVAAPGVDVTIDTTGVRGLPSNLPVGTLRCNGTSFAAPIVAALMDETRKAAPGKSAGEVWESFEGVTKRQVPSDWDKSGLRGRLVSDVTGAAVSPPPPPPVPTPVPSVGPAPPPPVVQPPPAPVQPTPKYNYYSGTVSMNLQYRSVDGSRLKTTSLSVNATFSNFKVQVAGPSTYFTQDTLKSSGTYQYTCKDDVSGNVASTTAQGTIGSVNPAIISLRGEPKGDTLPVSINTRYSMKETGADRKLHTGAGWSRYNDCDYQVGAADIQAGTAFFDSSSDPRTRTGMWNTTTRFSPADGGYLFTHQPKVSGDTINFTGQIADPKFTYDYSGTLSLKLDRTE